VDETGSESCILMGFGISSVEHLQSTTELLVIAFILLHLFYVGVV
jgi:hypothetical protein